MAFPKRFGLLSLLIGALAIPVAVAAVFATERHIPGSGAILAWLKEMGFVKEPVAGVASLSEASTFSINDENGIALLFAVAIFLASIAMVTALAAEYRRESTLYLSGGYVCGALAVALVKPLAGFIALIAGIIAVLVLRHGRT